MTAPVNVLMVGVGGQGVVLASDILAEAALAAGFDVKKSEIHGMSQRGGSVFSHVRFGAQVHSPMIPQGEADVLYGLERMELLRWATWARPGAVACYLAQDTVPTGAAKYPKDVDEEIARLFSTVVRIDPKEIRSRISPKVKNTVLLGAVSAFTPDVPGEQYLGVIPGLCPDGTAEVNQTGFRIGRELALEQLGVQNVE
ncbi:MAG TPA: indolepyruvate oxidoreductase subunit beta [Actinomycetaceae bacterium]|nr:indolepyruvate oxidoreductase subunit beta [Actinomycetaceae bacterium]